MPNETLLYRASDIDAANRILSELIESQGFELEQRDPSTDALALIRAAGCLIPFTAAFCIVNRRGLPPVYLCDTYPEGAAKEAVQRYVAGTYLLNPIYNAFLAGLPTGLHRMADKAPDNWARIGSDLRENEALSVLADRGEEIGYRTPGWPSGLQELSLTVNLPGDAMGEISFARPAAEGGITEEIAGRLAPFLPLFALAFRRLWACVGSLDEERSPRPGGEGQASLEEFARDRLTAREAEIVQLILKGHSSLSIGLTLDIALPTVKTHRRNAYAKLGIATQQQLFTLFLEWQGAR